MFPKEYLSFGYVLPLVYICVYDTKKITWWNPFGLFLEIILNDCMVFNSFTTQSRVLTTLGKKPVENVRKEENAGDQQFFL